MRTNDVLLSLRYLLQINNSKIVEICKLGNLEVQKDEIESYMHDENHPAFRLCSDTVLAHFLNGLIILKRGKDETRGPAPVDLPVSNNSILKKLRVAFELQEQDMIAIVNSSGLKIGKSELSAFWRKKDHRNYRECGDQVLRNFLKGLTTRLRSSEPLTTDHS